MLSGGLPRELERWEELRHPGGQGAGDAGVKTVRRQGAWSQVGIQGGVVGAGREGEAP